MIRSALSENDPVVVRQIQAIVREVCASGAADRAIVWGKLTADEKSGFMAMLNAPLIAPEDAQKLRDIASIWWDKFYPDLLESLMAQMFGWQAGSNYDRATIEQWLQTEDELVRSRITELLNYSEVI
ncbi:MAG: hypothetical protein HC786_11710 [Richelia sp. CSU_2_1]|nr:hypothetical protein [Richelia sp. CSU_2_1]